MSIDLAMKQKTKLWMPSRLYFQLLGEIFKQFDAGTLTRAQARKQRRKLDQKRQDFLTMRRLARKGYVTPVLHQDFTSIPPASGSAAPEAPGVQ